MIFYTKIYFSSSHYADIFYYLDILYSFKFTIFGNVDNENVEKHFTTSHIFNICLLRNPKDVNDCHIVIINHKIKR